MKYLVIILFLASCSPVKRVLDSRKYYDEVRAAVVRNGDCPKDSLEVSYDSVYTSVKVIPVRLPCTDLDTTLFDGTRVVVSSGVVRINGKDSIRIITKTIYDLAAINQANADRDSAKAREIRASNSESIVRVENRAIRKDVVLWKMYFGISCLVFVVYAFRKPIFKLISL